tara:strand:- start:4009 stop:4356 length:348 start_codon:yes stop_codon:yes gene_type:complete
MLRKTLLKKFKKIVGPRRMVYNGTAMKTSGGLEKKDLIKNKRGYIVSRKKHFTAKKEKRLQKYGYTAKKGKFGFVKMTLKKKAGKKHKKSGKKHKKSGKKHKKSGKKHKKSAKKH